MIQLTCTHCKHSFEMEKKEGAICPSCGWSSSILTAAELEKKKLTAAPLKKSSNLAGWLPGFFQFSLKFFGIVLLIFLFIWGGGSFLKSCQKHVKNLKSARGEQSFKVDRETSQKSLSQGLTLNEKSILHSKFEISAEPQLSDEDRVTLQKAIDLTVGQVEKLPSASWTLPQFKEFIQTQEKVFHMPLARSYKKSLEELFQKNYVAAYDLFLKGRFQQARDVYVASLGFPLYSSDLRKHRAVILTMMRTFINDTIAKVAAINFTLARQSVSGQTQQIAAMYADLQQKIRGSQWSDALSALEKLESQMPDVAAIAPILQAPPYTAGFEKVDADVQVSLLRLLQVPAFGFDAKTLANDLSSKKTVLKILTDPDRKKSVESYHQAIEKIAAQSWDEAASFLREVKSPVELKRDAEQKLELIAKWVASMDTTSTKKGK